MATIEARGYVNKYEKKTSAGGKTYARFTLAVQQKRKVNGAEVKEKVYFTCVDFKEGREPPGLHMSDRNELTAYVGVKGYLTVSNWAKDGKGGANLDVTVTEYEELEQKGGSPAPAAAPGASSDAPPSDPFALSPGKP